MSIKNIHDDYLDPDKHLWPDELPESNEMGLKLIDDYGSPFHLYRSIHKSGIGHSIGVEIDGTWIYNSDLPTDHYPSNHVYSGISVGSIVEGSDVEIEGAKLTGNFTEKQFWELVDKVADEVSFYWERDNSIWLELKTDTETIFVAQSASNDSYQSTNGDLKLAEKAVNAVLDNQNSISHKGKTYHINEYFPDYTY